MAGAFLLLSLLVLSGTVAAREEQAALRILHVNDLHGWLLPAVELREGAPGGLASLAATVDALRTETTLFVAAGDILAGTNISDFFQGRPVVESLNAMGLQATAVGNHEFDFGPAALAERVGEAAFPFLASNVSGPASEGFIGSAVIDAGDLKIALFGLTTPETPHLTHPRNVQGLRFGDPVSAAREAVAALSGQADLIVCLSHLGLGEDVKLAGKVPAIDVIVGGHTHTRLAEPLRSGGTLIVQAYERGAVLGVLDIIVRDGSIESFSGRLEPVDGRFGVDETVARIVERYRSRASRSLDVGVGTASVRFEGGRERVRTGETNLGSLLADIVMETAGADGAIVNGGSIRASIPAGPVTLAHLYNAFPFDNYVLAFELTGREVRRALETGLSRLEDRGGGFPHVAGFRYRFDPAGPPGGRLVSVEVGRAPLEDDKAYVVATNDFLAAGGDGFEVFQEKTPVFEDRRTLIREAVARYWEKQGSVRPAAPGRIAVAE